MPKNMFQRPLPVARTKNVPRHGAPLPIKKVERKSGQPTAAAELPNLSSLLKPPKTS